MKVLNFLIVFMLSLGFSFAQNNSQTVAQTPLEIQNFVNKHFPSHEIIAYKFDQDDKHPEHEVKLNEGIDLEFDQNLEIKEIDSKIALPMSIVSKEIREYLLKNYPNNKVLEWKRKSNGVKIELDNDVDLYFDVHGNFIRAED